MLLSKNKLLDYYNPIFAEIAYRRIRDSGQFRLETEQGFKTFMVSISEYQDGAYVELHLGTRIHEIENFVARYIRMLPEYGSDISTIMTSMARVQGISYKRYFIDSSEALKESFDEVEMLVNDIGIERLDYWQNMQTLNKVFNNDPYDLSLIYNPFNKSVRGLVLARFSANPNYEDLVKKYKYFLEYEKIPPENMNDFNRLVDVLNFFNPN